MQPSSRSVPGATSAPGCGAGRAGGCAPRGSARGCAPRVATHDGGPSAATHRCSPAQRLCRLFWRARTPQRPAPMSLLPRARRCAHARPAPRRPPLLGSLALSCYPPPARQVRPCRPRCHAHRPHCVRMAGSSGSQMHVGTGWTGRTQPRGVRSPAVRLEGEGPATDDVLADRIVGTKRFAPPRIVLVATRGGKGEGGARRHGCRGGSRRHGRPLLERSAPCPSRAGRSGCPAAPRSARPSQNHAPRPGSQSCRRRA